MAKALGIGDRKGAMGVAGDGDIRAKRLARGLDAPCRDVGAAIHDADPHLDRGKAAAFDIAGKLRADRGLVGPAARRIGGHAAGLASAQKLPDRYIQMLAKKVPQRKIDAADGGNRHAAPTKCREHAPMGDSVVAAHAAIHHLPEAADVAGILADDHRRVMMVDHRRQAGVIARAADYLAGLAPAYQSRFRFDPYQRAVKRCRGAEIRRGLLIFWNRNVDPACRH